MPVKNIECQIAEMQIGRHVSGEALSEEALMQLEAHLGKCPSCSRVLADRRTALRSMLHQGYAAVTTDVPAQHKEHLLIQALRAKAETPAPKAPRPAVVQADPQPPAYKKWSIDSLTKMTRETLTAHATSTSKGHASNPANSTTKSYAKPLAYSAALAVVLFFMGYMTRGQNSVLGDTAASSYPQAPAQSKNSRPANHMANVGSHYSKGAPVNLTSSVDAHLAPASQDTRHKPAPVPSGTQDISSVRKTQNISSAPTDPAPASQDTRHKTQDISPVSTTSKKRRTERVRHHPASVRISRPTNRITIYDASGNPLAG